nr:helix-turn-helix domain-containing protein [Streptomyces sp. NRRL WC-3702]
MKSAFIRVPRPRTARTDKRVYRLFHPCLLARNARTGPEHGDFERNPSLRRPVRRHAGKRCPTDRAEWVTRKAGRGNHDSTEHTFQETQVADRVLSESGVTLRGRGGATRGKKAVSA